MRTQHTANIPALPPVLSTINPTQVLSGGGDLTLAITGAGFLSNFAGDVRRDRLATTYGSATGLTATIPAALQTSGVYPITVVNSSPGSGTSKAINFTVLQQSDAAGQAQNIGENGGYFDISPVTSSSGFTLNGSSVHVVTTASTVFYDSSGGGITSTTFYDLLTDGSNVSVVGVYSNGTITAWSASLH